MMATFCVFNRTRESFLCLRAARAPIMASDSFSALEESWPERPKFAYEDGIWHMRSPSVYTVGQMFPVDRIYLDQENRVVQLIEHLDPLQIVPVRCRYASIVEARVRTIYSSRTRVGDELLICFPEEVQTQWEELRVRGTWTRQEVFQCSKG
jgi:hypothetical protein